MTSSAAGGVDGDLIADVRALLDRAAELRAEDPPAVARLAEQRQRLDEPLRVALVGRVKAGKSTLLNALVGARIAPTDAGECTRVVTLYRNGPTPRIVLHDTSGDQRLLPVVRVDGGLRLDLAGTPPEQASFVEVTWPSAGLAPATLIDTPGISSLSGTTSARTESLLEPDQRRPGADAVVFLTRQMQPDDVAFLRAFQGAATTSGGQTTTITVLSRADEVASGRLDALLAADDIARRMADDPVVRAVSSAVIPVAGLLGFAGRTLRQDEFGALETLARAPSGQVEAMVLTADRFARADGAVPVPAAERLALLDRLGLFGVRLSLALLRAGLADAPSLADELVRRSGLAELQRLIAVHFTRRGTQLKIGTALRVVDTVVRERPADGDADVRRELERLRLAAHEVGELELLARARGPAGPVPGRLREEAERLLGAEGTTPAARLGLPEDATAAELRQAGLAAIARWRREASGAWVTRPERDAIGLLVRSCEAVLAALEPRASAPGRAQPGADGAREQRHERQREQPGLGQ
jgi:hypothetical protein